MSERRAGLLAFFVAGATLALQVLVHRVVSAKLLNNYAFLVLSLTMLGFAAAGVALSFLRPRALGRLRDTAGSCAAGFGLSAILAVALFNHSRAEAPLFLSAREFIFAFLAWAPFTLLFALPFFFAGFLLGALLASPDFDARRIYFLDLVGSAAGAVAVLPALASLGAERALLAVAALLLAATLALAPPRSGAVRALALAAALALLVALPLQEQVFALYYPKGSILAQTRDQRTGVKLEHVAWDPIARIEVSRIPPPDPADELFLPLLGTNREFLSQFRLMLTQNNYAYTFAVRYDGKPESLRGIEETVYAAAYPPLSVPHPKVLVIGVGGGFDILNALYYGASEVTGVEVNAATLGILTRTYGDYFAPWAQDPRVRLVHGDGRHVLATSERTFDVIQLSGVDSYSGTPAAAHVFSENYLYTAEAFDLYLRRLSPDGILHMMRLEHRPPREMVRALTTAFEALRRAGVADPEQHVATLTALRGNIVSLLVKRSPFRKDEVERLLAWADGRPGFSVSAAPGHNEPARNVHQAFLTLRGAAREGVFATLYPFEITPTEDDRPFFFRASRWRHLFSGDPAHRGSGAPVMEWSLLLLLGVIGAAALLVVALPLRALAKAPAGAGDSPPRASMLPRGAVVRYGAFFAATGLGYLALEIALLQKFGLFLGHPSYALSVVLAALLFFTGLGSLLSKGIVAGLRGELRFAAYALAGVVLLEHLLLLPRLGALIGRPFALRCLVVASLVAPLGILLGVFLPTTLERLKVEAPQLVPWAWGINGIASVLAPILSVAFSMTFGIGALLLASLPVYLIAAWVLPRSRPAPGPAVLT